jgi:hypothetical protein
MSVSLDLDDELLRARSIQGVGAPTMEPIAIPPPKALGLSTVSSIESVERSKPNAITRILQAHTRTEELTTERSKQFEAYTNRSFQRVQGFEREQEEAFLKEIEANKGKDTWEAFSTIAQYVSCVASMTAAISLGWTTLPGFLLGAAALAGGLYRIAEDTHLLQPILEWYTHSRELQMELKQEMAQYAFLLQCGLGLAGGLAAWQAGLIAAFEAANVVNYTTQAASMLSHTSTAMSVAGRVGTAYYSKHMADYMAEGRRLDQATSQERYDMGRETRTIQEVLEDHESRSSQIKKAIQQQEVNFE